MMIKRDFYIDKLVSLRRTGDFFRKIVVVGGSQQPRLDNDGILYVGIVPFLMDSSILDSII